MDYPWLSSIYDGSIRIFRGFLWISHVWLPFNDWSLKSWRVDPVAVDLGGPGPGGPVMAIMPDSFCEESWAKFIEIYWNSLKFVEIHWNSLKLQIFFSSWVKIFGLRIRLANLKRNQHRTWVKPGVLMLLRPAQSKMDFDLDRFFYWKASLDKHLEQNNKFDTLISSRIQSSWQEFHPAENPSFPCLSNIVKQQIVRLTLKVTSRRRLPISY